MFASEYANQLAYEAIQIHGGSGYMKDYPIERIYRDARITNIYEGTTQLQVVAAIRHVTTGTFLAQMKAYEAAERPAEFKFQLDKLIAMREEYERAIARVTGGDSEQIEFHARRLVEYDRAHRPFAPTAPSGGRERRVSGACRRRTSSMPKRRTRRRPNSSPTPAAAISTSTRRF